MLAGRIVARLARGIVAQVPARGAASGGQVAQARPRRWGRVIVGSAVAGVLLAGWGGYEYTSRLRKNKEVSAEAYLAAQKEAIEQVLRSRETLLANELKLYGYSACPFFNKVRAFLQYHRIPFREVEVEPIFKSEISGVPYSKVPHLAIGPHVRLVDSDYIVDYLSPLYPMPSGPDELIWREWVSNELARLVVISINRSLGDAVAGYAYIDRFESIPWYNKLFLKLIGAPVMYLVARNVTRPRLLKLGYSDEMLASDSALYHQANRWIDSMGAQPFHGGASPSVADLAAFGVIYAMQGHPVYERLLSETRLRPWFERVLALMPRRADEQYSTSASG